MTDLRSEIIRRAEMGLAAGASPDDAVYRAMGMAIVRKHAGKVLTRVLVERIVDDLLSGKWLEE